MLYGASRPHIECLLLIQLSSANSVLSRNLVLEGKLERRGGGGGGGGGEGVCEGGNGVSIKNCT